MFSGKHHRFGLRAAFVAGLLMAASVARSEMITIDFSGTILGHYSGIDLTGQVPVGTAVDYSVTFQDRVGDGDLSDWRQSPGPVSGRLRVGGQDYGLGGFRDIFLRTNFDGSYEYSLGFTGPGPALGGGEAFSGLYMGYSSLSGWDGAGAVGYGRTFAGGGTAFGYLGLTGRTTVGPARVPEPSTLALVLGAALALSPAAARRRRAQRQAQTSGRASIDGR